jgi:hypothetical protein
MGIGIQKMKKASKEYIAKVTNLDGDETERLLSRMRGKLTRRIEDKKMSIIEAIAIQLELEDEQLAEWRENRIQINKEYKNP